MSRGAEDRAVANAAQACRVAPAISQRKESVRECRRTSRLASIAIREGYIDQIFAQFFVLGKERVSFMKRSVLPLCIWFAIAGYSAAGTNSAKIAGSVDCSNFLGKNNCTFTITVVGEIDPTAVDQVAKLLEQRREWHGSKQLVIDSPGGNVRTAMAIGRMLRKERMTLFIRKRGECVSACIMILAGAVKRYWSAGKVGIHRPYFDPLIGSQPLTAEQVRSNYEQMLQEIRAYLLEMNVSERLADDMLKVDPADVHYLSYNDLDTYGLTTIDPIEQETLDLREAQFLGLERREYIRRQALQKLRCDFLELQQQLGHEPDLPDFEACWQSVMKSGQ